MSNFAIENTDSVSDLVGSVNYLLANLNDTTLANVLVANTGDGTITNSTSGSVIAYLYQYLSVRYATSADGSTGFSTSPTNATYYGLLNSSSSVGSSNPADYIWYLVAGGGFSTNKFLFYIVQGGRQIGFSVTTSNPGAGYIQTTDGVAIDLDFVTAVAPGVITGNTIAANSITGNNIQQSTITGYNIAGNTITGNLIGANTILGSSIVAGSITATELAANVISAGNIFSFNANVGNVSSAGYWLEYNTGDALFAGNVYIGSNLNVSGLITQGNLNSNVVVTSSIADGAVSQTVYKDQAGTIGGGAQLIPFVNGTVYWPDDTRGYAVAGGATITPASNPNQGSRITVNYQAYVSSNDPANNLVELWKSGQISSYEFVYNACHQLWAYDADGSNLTTYYGGSDVVYAVGSDGRLATTADSGVTWTFSNTAGGPSLQTIAGVASAANTANSKSVSISSSSSLYITYNNSTLSFSANGSLTQTADYNKTHLFAANLGTANVSAYRSTYSVGSNGTITYSPGATSSPDIPWPVINVAGTYAITSNVTVDLYDVATEYVAGNIRALNKTGGTAMVCGAGGTIIYNEYSNYGATTVYPFIPATTANTTADINGIINGADVNTWVAVGSGGTILKTVNGNTYGSVAFYAQTSPTAATLNSVCYSTGFGYVAVGYAGTIIKSADGTTWTTCTSPTDRNLTKVIVGANSGKFFIFGDAFIAVSAAGNPNSWTVIQEDPSVLSTTISRIAWYGSNQTVSNVSTPPGYQQIGNVQISGNYIDTAYTANVDQSYYVVVGSLSGNATYSTGASLTVTEAKR